MSALETLYNYDSKLLKNAIVKQANDTTDNFFLNLLGSIITPEAKAMAQRGSQNGVGVMQSFRNRKSLDDFCGDLRGNTDALWWLVNGDPESYKILYNRLYDTLNPGTWNDGLWGNKGGWTQATTIGLLNILQNPTGVNTDAARVLTELMADPQKSQNLRTMLGRARTLQQQYYPELGAQQADNKKFNFENYKFKPIQNNNNSEKQSNSGYTKIKQFIAPLYNTGIGVVNKLIQTGEDIANSNPSPYINMVVDNYIQNGTLPLGYDINKLLQTARDNNVFYQALEKLQNSEELKRTYGSRLTAPLSSNIESYGTTPEERAKREDWQQLMKNPRKPWELTANGEVNNMLKYMLPVGGVGLPIALLTGALGGGNLALPILLATAGAGLFGYGQAKGIFGDNDNAFNNGINTFLDNAWNTGAGIANKVTNSGSNKYNTPAEKVTNNTQNNNTAPSAPTTGTPNTTTPSTTTNTNTGTTAPTTGTLEDTTTSYKPAIDWPTREYSIA